MLIFDTEYPSARLLNPVLPPKIHLRHHSKLLITIPA
jgi:hypothetical protein